MCIEFGFCVPVFASPGSALFRTPNFTSLHPQTTMDLSIQADQLGYDSLWVADHLMLGKDNAILEGWTVLSALAGATKQAKLGIIHQANYFRNPAHVAKMSATIDQISGGRFIYFTDPGSAKQEHVAYGLPWTDDQTKRIKQFQEGLHIITTLWASDDPLSYAGQYYSLSEAVCTPKPVQNPYPPIWIGSVNSAMHTICAKYAQGWNTTPISLEGLRERLHDLRTACDDVGRSYDTIEKSLEIQILIGEDIDAIREKLKNITSLGPSGKIPKDLASFLSGTTDSIPDHIKSTWLIGTPDEIDYQIQAYVNEGITHFMLWFVDAPEDNGLRHFAREVLPRFRS